MDSEFLEEKLVTLLEKARNINISAIHASAAAKNKSSLDALERIIQTLSSQSRNREADAVRIARDQCLESKAHGGLGLDLADTNNSGGNEDVHEAILFQTEVWLEALNSEDRARRLRPGITSKPAGRRPMTLSEKILAHHAVSTLPSEGPTVGDTVRVRVDWVISSELAWAVSRTTMRSVLERP